jgi:hypothetical protein
MTARGYRQKRKPGKNPQNPTDRDTPRGVNYGIIGPHPERSNPHCL